MVLMWTEEITSGDLVRESGDTEFVSRWSALSHDIVCLLQSLLLLLSLLLLMLLRTCCCLVYNEDSLSLPV